MPIIASDIPSQTPATATNEHVTVDAFAADTPDAPKTRHGLSPAMLQLCDLPRRVLVNCIRPTPDQPEFATAETQSTGG